MRKIRFLGTGTSTGVPTIGCECEVCKSTNPKDKRLRTSMLYENGDTQILVDCGPDFRTQVLDIPFKALSAVLLSHEHYDHVAGLDDLRAYSCFGDIPIFAERYTADHLRERMPYCFVNPSYPGIPKITLHDIDKLVPFLVDDIEVMPIRVIHGRLPILGYRIGKEIAYITDMSRMPVSDLQKLKDLKILVVNALRIEPHRTHQCLDEAIAFAQKVNAERTYFIHMSHDIGFHDEISKKLPNNLYFAFDGLEIDF